MTRYYCTLFDKNYLIRGLALHSSLIEHGGDFHLWILCMDELTLEILQKKKLNKVTLIKLEEFEDQGLLKIKESRTHGEYCWTCTPSLMIYLLKKYPKIDLLSYIDSDLYFYSSPEPIFKEIGTDSIMIVPHRFVKWRKHITKIVGIYNVSMVTMKNNTTGKECANWWRKKCLEWCYNRHENGKMGDQKYLESFPKLFKGVHSLKHVGAGTATWNIPQYKIWEQKAKVMINNVPLIFFHFQALKIYRPVKLLTQIEVSSYTERGPARSLIYLPYIDALNNEFKKLTQLNPDFNYGFSHRPGIRKYAFQLTVAGLSFLKNDLF